MHIIRARCANVNIRLVLRLRGLKESQRKYWPMKVEKHQPEEDLFHSTTRITKVGDGAKQV